MIRNITFNKWGRKFVVVFGKKTATLYEKKGKDRVKIEKGYFSEIIIKVARMRNDLKKNRRLNKP